MPSSSLRIDPLPRQGIVGALNEALNASGQVNMEGFVQDVLRLAYAVMPLGERAPYIVPTGPRHVSAAPGQPWMLLTMEWALPQFPGEKKLDAVSGGGTDPSRRDLCRQPRHSGYWHSYRRR